MHREMETKPGACICCNNTHSSKYAPGLKRCDVCGHVWYDAALSREEIQKLYSSRYYEGEEYLNYEKEAKALRLNFRPRVKELARKYPQGSLLFEIGAAYGFFLLEAARHFAVSGCEISQHAAQYAQNHFGLDVQCKDYLSIEFDAPRDVICLWDTIEHLREPRAYIEKVANDLRPGGTIAFTTGDIGSRVARWQGPRWRLLHPPTHLHYFTADSARRLLSSAGFVDVQIRRHAFWRTATSAAHGLLAAPGKQWGAKIYTLLERMGALNFVFPVNLYDIMTVYARKSE